MKAPVYLATILVCGWRLPWHNKKLLCRRFCWKSESEL